MGPDAVVGIQESSQCRGGEPVPLWMPPAGFCLPAFKGKITGPWRIYLLCSPGLEKPAPPAPASLLILTRGTGQELQP